MNSQRVNFYHARFYPQRHFLSLPTVLRAWLFLLLALLGGYLGLQAYLGEREAAWARQQAGMQRVVADENGTRDLLSACQSGWQAVEQSLFRSNPRPIAPLLEQLAHNHMAGIWLTNIQILEGGEQVVVQGHITPQLSAQLPNYLQRLARQSAMVGRDLRDFQLEKEPVSASKGSAAVATVEQPYLKFRVTFGKEAKP